MKSIMRFLGWLFEEVPGPARWTVFTLIFLAVLATTGVFGILVTIAAALWLTQIILIVYLLYYVLVRDRRVKKAKSELIEKEEFEE